MTIDEVIQHYVESALEQVQLDTNAERAMAIVMEPSTGYVLAMACYPISTSMIRGHRFPNRSRKPWRV